MATLPSSGNLKLDNSLGALLIGLIVSTALFGLTTLQTYMYYVEYGKDRAAYKWLVGILWLLDFTHTIFISHSAYYFLIQQYGNPSALLEGEWSIILEVTVTVLVTVLVQFFFAHRVYRLSHGNWIVAGLIVFLAFGHAALGITSTIKLFQIHRFARLPEVLGVLSATLIVMAVNDVIITIALCWYLHKTQHTSGSHDAVQLLIIYTIETGLVTSVFVTIDAAVLLAMPRNWIFIGMEFCVSKLYANSLLTILNSRRSVRKKFGDITPASIPTLGPPANPQVSVALRRIQITTHEDAGARIQLPKYSDIGDSPQPSGFHDQDRLTYQSSTNEDAGNILV